MKDRSLDEIFGNGSGDWPEDFPFENGNYTNDCSECGQRFMGNKHRFICKKCSTAEMTVNSQRYKELLEIEMKYEKLDKWYWSREL